MGTLKPAHFSRKLRHGWAAGRGRFRSGLAGALLSICLVAISASACAVSSSPLIFVSDRDGNLELYSVGPAGEGETNLTDTVADEFSPVISPNGKLVAFLSGSGDDVALEVMELNGTERRRLTTGPGRHGSQRWSPNSSRITYLVENDTSTSIYMVDADGSNPTLLTAITEGEVGDWSPDGQSVVYAMYQGDKRGIHVRNPDGVNYFRLTEELDFSPLWSPDSKTIAFLSRRDGNPEIYVMNADGSEQKRVSDSEGVESDLSWSPDGTRLLFVSDRDGNAEIYVTDIDGGNLERLTHNDVRDRQPIWSPNGKRIAFVSEKDAAAEMFVMDSDGSNQSRLTNNGFRDDSPTW